MTKWIKKINMDKYNYDIDVDAFVLRKTDFDYAYSIDITSEIILDVNQIGRAHV